MKKLIAILAMVTILAILVIPAQASETQTQDPYIWVQEGDETYCYIDNGRWSEADMLTGWHQIGGELYWFEDSDFSDERPIGSMAKDEWIWINDAEWHFDEYGHLDEWRVME